MALARPLRLLHAHVPIAGALSVHDTVGVAQLAFASVAVAGAGVLVALVVAYRREHVAQTASSNDGVRVFNERFTTIAAQLGDTRRRFVWRAFTQWPDPFRSARRSNMAGRAWHQVDCDRSNPLRRGALSVLVVGD